MSEAEVSIEQVMARRFELVEQMAIIAGRHKNELAPLGEELDLCEQYIWQAMGELQQVSTTFGTAFFKGGSRAQLDKDAFPTLLRYIVESAFLDSRPDPRATTDDIVEHILTHGRFQLLKKDVSKTAVEEIVEAEKTPPPGVKYETFRTLQFRKKN